jgi:hypothetical protein
MPEENPVEKRYPSNSHAQKDAARRQPAEPERPRAKKVIKGEVSTRVPLGRRIAQSFKGDDAQTVGEYVLFDVILPTVKDLIVDAGKEIIERAIFGTSSGPSKGARRNSGGSSFSGVNNRTNYRNRYSGRNFDDDRDDRRTVRDRARSSRGYEDVILETRGDAEEALDALREHIAEYGDVTVADLYDMVGADVDGRDYVGRSWGWNDLRDAEVKRLRSDQYLLDLPPTIRLD